MKKTVLVLGVLMFMGFMVGSVFCEEGRADYSRSLDKDKIDYRNSPLNKLGRGVINTASCWAEIPAEAIKVTQAKDPLIGVTLGVAQGTVTGILRGITGIVDTLTFFVPPYNKPKMKPEYALTGLDKKFKEYFW